MRMSDWSSEVCSSDLHASRRLHRGDGNLTGVLHEDRHARFPTCGLDQPAFDREWSNARKDIAAILRVGDNRLIDENLQEQIRSEEHTSELQSLMRISYAVFCLKKKKKTQHKIY